MFWTYLFYLSFLLFTLVAEAMAIEDKSEEKQAGAAVIYIILTIAGLVTSQWFLFLILVLLGLLTGLIRRKFGKDTPVVRKWAVIDSYFCMLFAIFIVINRFHLHYTFL
jgi:hypothetical protein